MTLNIPYENIYLPNKRRSTMDHIHNNEHSFFNSEEICPIHLTSLEVRQELENLANQIHLDHLEENYNVQL